MLKNIRLHLEKDAEKQAQLDDELAQQIIDTRNYNINAFQRNIPSLLPYLTYSKLRNYAPFNNRYGQVNIVDCSVGRTLYGFHPAYEVSQQVSQALQNSPCVDLTQIKNSKEFIEEAEDTFDFRELKSFKIEQAQRPLPDEVECLVVLGCGLGLHIKQLLENRKIKNLIIYEPEVQYFQCSILTTSWQDIFTLAKKQGTALFLQLEKDGSELLDDINEIKEHASISSFHIYKHYNHQVFDSVYRDLCERDWQDISNNGFIITQPNNPLEYIPTWTPKIDLALQSPVSTESKLFEKNLQAFKKYFPDIYGQYKDYTPKIWLPIKNTADEVNVLKEKGLNTWYGDSPKQDCILNFENFNEQPNKDGLVLGYGGKKLAHYIHYQFVNETQELLKEAKEEVGELPETVASIIMFGLGVGYQLEKLLSEHRVEKLFICEPNPDFFYASLFAIDWQAIFEKIDATDGKIYLNVGDDGTDLFRGLVDQFHVMGSYILNNTYFYQSYYNASLNSAIAQLRENLKILISLGENFDYVYYSIEHTKEGFRRNIPLLTKNPSSKLSYLDKEVPVFIVGNGPSLDMSIEAIKEYREQAIVISCGTALQALHRNGITPDFHAEVEQNRCTYDWPVLIGDLEFLKKITLISTNGIHPDTCELYKDVLVAFKEGESSTGSALKVLGRQHFEVLQHAFPTVSNFVTDLVSVLGFDHIYLIGVDLGFVDVKHHHSKSSGYYKEDGKETHDYAKRNNTSLIVPGNFRPRVNTKHEFKMSRQMIEKVTAKKPKEQIFYNCSDGAKISETSPLHIDSLLIMSPPSQKQHTIKKLKSSVFSTQFNSNFIEMYENKFSHSLLIEELNTLEQLLEQDTTTIEQVNNLINEQKEMLFSSYKNDDSLLFNYLYSTLNYSNAILIKTYQEKEKSNDISSQTQKALSLCHNTIGNIKRTLANTYPQNYDTSSYKVWVRELINLKAVTKGRSLLVVTDDAVFMDRTRRVLADDYPFINNVKFMSSNESHNCKEQPDYTIYCRENSILSNMIEGKYCTLVVTDTLENHMLNNRKISYFLSLNIEDDNIISDTFLEASTAIKACLSEHNCNIILPKYFACNKTIFGSQVIPNLPKKHLAYEYPFYFCLYTNLTSTEILPIPANKSRGKKVIESINMSHLKYVMSQEDLNKIKDKHLKLLSSEINL
jgi:hypothetical protein